uniref:ADAM metallopeptidase with thrombospondin type 1 motif 16 n=1 Tax=Suricata suricatta TaxID=37032 RepID=A0A673SW10_SURSU
FEGPLGASAGNKLYSKTDSQTLLFRNCSANPCLCLSEYELVSPYEVDRHGYYVSHEVTHPQRRKRALAQLGVESLHLRLKGFRHDFHMELKASSTLLAPGFVVQTLGKGGTKSVHTFPPEDFCFYQGSLRSHKNSSVALSTCKGLSGMIRTQEADYFLKPLPSQLAGTLGDAAGAGPPSHILYKRSADQRAPGAPQAVMTPRDRELGTPHLHGGSTLRHPQKQHFCGRRKKYMPQPPEEDLFVLPDEYASCSRPKRSLLKSHRNEELNVETLVVVDRKMIRTHGHENITTYVLTILNMVSALFKDGTIGGNINIAIVGLILLEEDQPGLVISHHADRTLNSFCQWQSGLMGKDGTRHDHAILLTGLDICSWKNEPCDTLGFAPISGMCSKYRSCTINEDTGLGLAFTIAHESGHKGGCQGGDAQALGLSYQHSCKLYCVAEGFDFFFSLSNKVKDGTPCSEDSRNVCVDGTCERVGCDNVLGSDAVEDSCGVCRGNNSDCTTHKGLYAKHHGANQYYQMVTIPAGARSVHIREMNVSTSYISVRNALRKYYLNGHWTVDWPGRYKFAGATFDYRRSSDEPESLTSSGPTNETLVVELLFQGRNPGMAWEYSVPQQQDEKKPSGQPRYSWAVIRSECSVSCGGGHMTTREGCYRDLRLQVNASFCNPSTRPVTGVVACHVSACPPSWSVGNWNPCSRTCGGGTQSRLVQCTRRAHFVAERVPASLCPQPMPSSRQACQSQSCPPAWSTGPWTECSRTCGKGWRKRSVACKSTSPAARPQLLPDAVCSSEPKPRTHGACLLKRCYKLKKLQWLLSAWSQCSATCERGTQRRFLKCAEKHISGKYRELASKKCLHLPQPSVDLERVCAPFPCPRHPLHAVAGPPRPGWFASPWSQCTASCGGGVQTRTVQCLAGSRPAPGCSVHQKPAASLACNTHFCPIAEKKAGTCRDHFPWCPLAPRQGLCSHQFYSEQCCKTCSASNL